MRAMLFLLVIWLAASVLCKSKNKIPSKTTVHTSSSSPVTRTSTISTTSTAQAATKGKSTQTTTEIPLTTPSNNTKKTKKTNKTTTSMSSSTTTSPTSKITTTSSMTSSTTTQTTSKAKAIQTTVMPVKTTTTPITESTISMPKTTSMPTTTMTGMPVTPTTTEKQTKKTVKTTSQPTATTTTTPITTKTATPATTTPTTRATTTPTPPSEVTFALTKFTISLYQELTKMMPSESNLFVSPFSVAVVLSMLKVGARGETSHQLLEILNFYDYATDLSEDEINQEIGTLLRSAKGTGNVTLETANQIYVADSLSLFDSFQSAMMAYFGAEAQVVDFSDDNTRVIINNWVEEVTHHMIKQLLPEGSINGATTLVLVNALYFKANWKLPFDLELTSDRTFYLLGSEDMSVDVSTMSISDKKFRMGFFEDLNARVLEIPYEGDVMSMFVILPNDMGGLPQLEKQLNSSFLDHIDDKLYLIKITSLCLPKFDIETDVGMMKEALIEMGLSDLFTEQCNLSGMSDDATGFYVSHVAHKAAIKVNEQGTEAAAATAGIVPASMGPIFEVNHPALFFIRDNRSKLILFIGRLINPARKD